MDSNFFNNALSRAAMLMNDEHFNNLVESKTRGGKNKGNNDLSHLEARAFNHMQTPQQNSVLPNAIIESFNARNKVQNEVPQASINETFTYTPPQVQHTSPSQSVNYDIIKALIDESISRHLNEIRQTLINENVNTMKGFSFSEGNKVTFVDKRGNIYEGKLQLKKKATT